MLFCKQFLGLLCLAFKDSKHILWSIILFAIKDLVRLLSETLNVKTG